MFENISPASTDICDGSNAVSRDLCVSHVEAVESSMHMWGAEQKTAQKYASEQKNTYRLLALK